MMRYRLSKHAKDVMNERKIRNEWVERVITAPSLIIEKQRDEVHLYLSIVERENRCLKVVINPVNMIVVTTYFDRDMRKRGCQ